MTIHVFRGRLDSAVSDFVWLQQGPGRIRSRSRLTGLVCDAVIEEGGVVNITMTTTRGCPATSYLKDGARDAASAVPTVEFVDVKLTYEPAWTPRMMSADAKQHLGVMDGGGW